MTLDNCRIGSISREVRAICRAMQNRRIRLESFTPYNSHEHYGPHDVVGYTSATARSTSRILISVRVQGENAE